MAKNYKLTCHKCGQSANVDEAHPWTCACDDTVTLTSKARPEPKEQKEQAEPASALPQPPAEPDPLAPPMPPPNASEPHALG